VLPPSAGAEPVYRGYLQALWPMLRGLRDPRVGAQWLALSEFRGESLTAFRSVGSGTNKAVPATRPVFPPTDTQSPLMTQRRSHSESH
jgi:hypothetical protein